MKQILFHAFGVLLFCAIGSAIDGLFDPTENMHRINEITFIGRHNIFTQSLYAAVANNSEGNMIFSPFSIGLTLGMAFMGSGGNTEFQIRGAMGFAFDPNFTKEQYSQILDTLKEPMSGIDLKVVNGMYLSNTLNILDEYSSLLSENFDSAPQVVDFAQAEETRQLINEAVSNATKSKIEEIIPKDSFDASTMMVLVNALYFNGLWEHPFSAQSTTPSSFWITKDQSVQVDMMKVYGQLEYRRIPSIDATEIKIPFQGKRVFMTIVLPNARDGLAELETNLEVKLLWKVEAAWALSFDATLYLPKFRLEKETELVDALKELGINDAFEMGAANFQKIADQSNLHISEARHKAFIQVAENGTEAAAATAIQFRRGSVLGRYEHAFRVDHPFMFFITDSVTGQYLFAGRVTNPNDN